MMDARRPAERHAEAVRMPLRAPQREPFAAPGESLIGIPERPQRPGRAGMTDDARIDVVYDGVGAMPLAVVDRRRAVEVSPRLHQDPAAEQDGSPRHVRLEEEIGVS